MSKRMDAITEAIIAAVRKARTDGSMQMTRSSELLQRMDSLELMIAFADIQGTLGLEFEPEHLLQLFLCQSIEEMVVVIAGMANSAVGPGNLNCV